MTTLSEEKKLLWLGIKRANDDESAIKGEVIRLRENTEGYTEYRDAVNGFDTHEEHEDYLESVGFPPADAELFTTKIEDNFTDWEGYRVYIVVQADSFDVMKNAFPTEVTFGGVQTTSVGELAAGIRIHDEDAVSKNGIPLPAGTIEIFGSQVEFSKADDPDVRDRDIAYSNLVTSTEEPTVDVPFTVSVDIENAGEAIGTVYPQFTVNGVVEEQKGVTLNPGETKTVSFEYAHPIPGTLYVNIEDTDQTEVRVNASSL